MQAPKAFCESAIEGSELTSCVCFTEHHLIVIQAGAVSHISFTQQHPYHFAVTSSTRVSITAGQQQVTAHCTLSASSNRTCHSGLQVIVYDAVTRQVRRQFTRFKDKAYCGNFRADSKLLVAGGEDGIVQARHIALPLPCTRAMHD